MLLRRMFRAAVRVMAIAVGTVAVGISINQVLNGGVWDWRWLGAAALLSGLAEGTSQWLSRHPPQSSEPSEPVRGTPRYRSRLVRLPAVSGAFVGRATELTELDTALAGQGPVVVAAVHGLGGIGKSTLAARYAADHTERFTLVWWITADTPSAVTSGLAELAVALLLPEHPGHEDLEVLAERAISWLADHDGWLLVLDNVSGPADVAPRLARLQTGRVVLTSRLAQDWHRVGAQVLRLDVLTENQAVDLLTRLARPANTDVDGWRAAPELVRELGLLPLAVDQAGAYLAQARLTPATYLGLLRGRPDVIYDRASQGSDGERTIARIWRVTLDRLTTAQPLAGDVLRILSWWAPEGIPRGLLRPLTDDTETVEALGVLAAYSMITLSTETVTVHRLVQAVARTPDPADPHRGSDAIAAARDRATELLNQARPRSADDPTLWPAWRLLLPHIEALADHTTPDTDTDKFALLLSWTGDFLRNQAAHQRALVFHERVLGARERLLGNDHPSTLGARNSLALAYRQAGRVDDAITLHERNLADRERLLGDDHRDTRLSRSNLAFAYRVAGRFDLALSLMLRTVGDRDRIYGPDHRSTLHARSNLALVYRDAGDLDRAVPLLEQNLADRERVLGNDHPKTMLSRHYLAGAYRIAGRVDLALPLLLRTVSDRERVLGPDNPSTLRSRAELALVYRDAGELDQAVRILEQNVADRERVLGDDHPETVKVRQQLAIIRAR